MSLRPTLDFLLYQWLDAESLNQRERFTDHSRETFDAVFDTCERIAREKYAPFNRTVDTQEPHFDGEKVILPQATHEAQKAYAASGMLSAAQDYEIGGMQLPYTVEAAANAFFAMGKADDARAANERAKQLLHKLPSRDVASGSNGVPLAKMYWEQWIKWTSTSVGAW